MTGEYYCATGDVDEAISIMREAARWLADTGRPMWVPQDLDRGALRNPPEEFVVLYDANGAGVAALLLSFEDRFFWPDIPRGQSGFIHKLAIRRAYAGKGLADRLIACAAAICRQKGAASLRLDCDARREGLRRFYERVGFQLVELKTVDTARLGKIDLALYKLDV